LKKDYGVKAFLELRIGEVGHKTERGPNKG